MMSVLEMLSVSQSINLLGQLRAVDFRYNANSGFSTVGL